MKVRSIVGVCTLLLIIFGTLSVVSAQNGCKISAPYSYKNLTIFLLHGKGESSGKNVLTLQEAMERKVFFVYETSDVNELEVEIDRNSSTCSSNRAISSRAGSKTVFWR